MKGLFIGLMLIASSATAAVQWPEINVQDRDASFLAGYAAASIYDVYVHYKHIDIHKTRMGMELGAAIPIPFGEEYPYLGWKLGLGLAAGAALAISHADRDNSQIPFNDIVFGGLGGLTCIVFHF